MFDRPYECDGISCKAVHTALPMLTIQTSRAVQSSTDADHTKWYRSDESDRNESVIFKLRTYTAHASAPHIWEFLVVQGEPLRVHIRFTVLMAAVWQVLCYKRVIDMMLVI